jgi:GNAT superfamily N-acetyltransferase
MIRLSTQNDFDDIYEIINDAAIAYKGVIPGDRWHEPYMSGDELRKQIDDGVQFHCYLDGSRIIGVMGIQDRGTVNLIRHAYVRTSRRNTGIGSRLLEHLMLRSGKPLLIGTWKAAFWAVNFYKKHGFTLVSEQEKNALLKKYWKIPERQIETSVVLADKLYREQGV